MKIKKTNVLFAAAALVCGVAMAQGAPGGAPIGAPPPGGTHPGGHFDPAHAEKMQKQHAKHLQELKAALKLQPAQEANWKTFEESMKPPARPAGPPAQTDDKLTTPQRLDLMQEIHQHMAAEMQKRAEAIKTFYGTLDDGQKKTFDAEFGKHARKHQPRRERPHE